MNSRDRISFLWEEAEKLSPFQKQLIDMTIFSKVDKDSILGTGVIFITFLFFYSYVSCGERAFDFTDESFYLLNIQSPSLYYEGSQFGFVYHPLYELVGRNISLFRMIDFLFFFSLTIVLTIIVMRLHLYDIYEKKYFAIILGIVSICNLQNSISPHGDLTCWLATPSYNSLNFASLLVCMIGVVLMDDKILSRSLLALVLVGFGVSLSFLAKPTSSLLLSFFLLIYILVFKKQRKKKLFIIGVVFCIHIIIGAYIIDKSLYEFILRLKTVCQDSVLMNDGHGITALFRKMFYISEFIRRKHLLPTSFFVSLSIFPVVIGIFLIYGMICHRASLPKVFIYTMSTCLLSGCLLFIFYRNLPVNITRFISMSVNFSIILVSAICVIFVYLSDYKNIFGINFYKNIPLALFFCFIPLVYAVGTNFDNFYFGGRAAIFWVLAAVIMARPLAVKKGWNFLLPFVITLQLIVSFSLALCKQHPYRQGTNMGKLQVETRMGGGTLKLSEAFARYIDEARRNARQGGFVPGTPVVDLTGQSPGILYALEAEAVGRGWFIGSYPGSMNFAAHVLKQRVPQEKLQQSWFLVEPEGERSIPDEIFERLGLNFPEDYDLRAEWQVPRGAGTRAKPAKQRLYAPKSHKITPKDSLESFNIPAVGL